MIIRDTADGDVGAVLDAQRQAFGREAEADLVRTLLSDPSAEPLISLLAVRNHVPVGHILFTPAKVGDQDRPAASLLAPLAVLPRVQGSGIGRALVAEGLARCAAGGIALVFVFGDPAYYTRFGFTPAAPHDLAPPFAVAPEHVDAWMVRPSCEGVLGRTRGKVRCADALMRPELWA